MRNCFRQFADGVAGELDVHCYSQHAYAADLAPKNANVLDVCCGRGLLIPFLRYRGNAPRRYVGVDIHAANAGWRDGKDPRGENRGDKTDWGFPLVFVESNVAEMAKPVARAVNDEAFDLIVYTSAIEHMQPEAQQKSLVECRKLANAQCVLYLTCPITEAGKSGYDCQYAAHVYEPTHCELDQWLANAGWRVDKRIGLSTGVKAIKSRLTGDDLKRALHVLDVMPREFALPTVAALFPACALEMAFVCRPKDLGLFSTDE
jgi:SAM-dependent methyltransferase